MRKVRNTLIDAAYREVCHEKDEKDSDEVNLNRREDPDAFNEP